MAASSKPPSTIFLRPIRSDNVPKTTKKGVASNSAMMTRMLAVTGSTFSVCVKNSSV